MARTRPTNSAREPGAGTKGDARLDGHTVRGARTRLTIILAAERLFAERGIDAVSLREVAVAARQRNPAVVQYHFGSKSGLVEAILDHRRARVIEMRSRMLAEIDAAHASGDAPDPAATVSAAVEAIVLPLAQLLDTADAGYFLRLLHQRMHRAEARAVVVPTDDALAGVPPSTQSAYRALQLIERALSDLDPSLVEARLNLAMLMVVGALAQRDRMERSGIRVGPARERFVEELVDAVVVMLLRPASPSGASRPSVRSTRRAPRRAR